jgi:hypothetical protein
MRLEREKPTRELGVDLSAVARKGAPAGHDRIERTQELPAVSDLVQRKGRLIDVDHRDHAGRLGQDPSNRCETLYFDWPPCTPQYRTGKPGTQDAEQSARRGRRGLNCGD